MIEMIAFIYLAVVFLTFFGFLGYGLSKTFQKEWIRAIKAQAFYEASESARIYGNSEGIGIEEGYGAHQVAIRLSRMGRSIK